MELFVPQQIATDDGRVFEALAISNAGLPQNEWPLDMIAPSGDVENALRGDDLVRAIDDDTDYIDRLAAWPLSDLGLDMSNPPNQVEALARLVGYTEAVPFQQPRPTQVEDEWYCIGGRVQRSGRSFLVPSVRLGVPLATGGFVGLQISIEPVSALMTGVSLAVAPIAGINTPSDTQLFVPLWVLCTDGVWIGWPWFLPSERSTYCVLLHPSGPSGTLLT